ncbi:uncharacterized protein LOC107006360 [Solanum pennellii]|uniref:Uncharacterized protein LOC107006360 n=1 Tax=Solanum pennellii TaxID=28526 RepID=A0ABM1FQX1_SOLPN|nr:uncharacterized protein LOC107006360 [Solanum pennellii]
MDIQGVVSGTQSGTSMSFPTFHHLHPLYLYPSDSPRSLNVGILLAGSGNYTLWSKAMELAFLGKNKVGFINGTVKKMQFTEDLTRLWDRCNAIVVSWIFCNVSKDLHSVVIYCSDSYLIWEDLKERLKDVWDEYDSIMPPPACTSSRSKEFFEQSQHQRMLQFLMGLNDNYSQARSQILLMPQLPRINQAYAMVNQDESQKMVAGSSRMMPDMAPTAMFTSKSGLSSHKPRRPYNPNAFVISAI